MLLAMGNKSFAFPKEERLCWNRYLDRLFAEGKSFVAYPFRVVFLSVEEETLPPVSLVISVPKKRLKLAVQRNRVKRQVREAYRLRKHILSEPLAEANKHLLIGFVYVDVSLHPSTDIGNAMDKTLRKLSEKCL